jgi:hypothetical protein
MRDRFSVDVLGGGAPTRGFWEYLAPQFWIRSAIFKLTYSSTLRVVTEPISGEMPVGEDSSCAVRAEEALIREILFDLAQTGFLKTENLPDFYGRDTLLGRRSDFKGKSRRSLT